MEENIDELEVLEDILINLGDVRKKIDITYDQLLKMMSEINNFIEYHYKHYDEAYNQKNNIQDNIMYTITQLQELKAKYSDIKQTYETIFMSEQSMLEDPTEYIDEIIDNVSTIYNSFKSSVKQEQYDELYSYLQGKEKRFDNLFFPFSEDVRSLINNADNKYLEIESKEEKRIDDGENTEKTTETKEKLNQEYVEYTVTESDLEEAKDTISKQIDRYRQGTAEQEKNDSKEQGE